MPVERIVNTWERDDLLAWTASPTRRPDRRGRGRAGRPRRRARSPSADHGQGDPARQRAQVRPRRVRPGVAFYVLWKLCGPRAGDRRRDRRRARSRTATSGSRTARARRPDRARVRARSRRSSGSWTGQRRDLPASRRSINSGLCGLAFIGSAMIGRPLAGVFAEGAVPAPRRGAAVRTHRRVFARISLAWGAYMLFAQRPAGA